MPLSASHCLTLLLIATARSLRGHFPEPPRTPKTPSVRPGA